MTDQEEMEQALEQILHYCQRRRIKKNQAIFDSIATAIVADRADVQGNPDALAADIKSRYLTAVSALMMLADPPAADVLDATLARINSSLEIARREGQPLTDVRFVDDANDEATLRQRLGERRIFSPEAEARLAHLREKTSRRLWSRGREDSPRSDGNG
ncbi:hypothetical protein GmRootV118_11200 [Variovorax sp. V118]|uniref:hypothetical protein n=1 Tax=Variovorax sp. V118 TaxID=3065954 RepID=UPI0034E8AEA0